MIVLKTASRPVGAVGDRLPEFIGIPVTWSPSRSYVRGRLRALVRVRAFWVRKVRGWVDAFLNPVAF